MQQEQVVELILEVDYTLKLKVDYMYPLDILEVRLLLEHKSAEVRTVVIANVPIWWVKVVGWPCELAFLLRRLLRPEFVRQRPLRRRRR